MSSEAKGSGHAAQTITSSSAPNGNNSSSLEFTESDSNDPPLAPHQPRSPSKSTFQWPSEPLNQGRPSLPQDSQQSVEDANRDISQRITDADQDATSTQAAPYPGLDHPRLSAQLTATLNNIEDDRREQLSSNDTEFVSASAASLPMLSPRTRDMNRTSSNGTQRSAGSDRPDAAPANPHQTSFLPDMLRNAASIPLDLLRSLIPDNTFPSTSDEGLSASTLQVPVTSFNALFEACKTFEWLANQAAQLEAADKGSGHSRRPSTTQQQSDDGVDFTHFDYFQILQKVADVVSGLAASRGIDLVLDLDPKLQGEPADNQRHYKLGSCIVWADRIALTFLFMSCISRLLRNSPIQSTIVITTTLTPKDENVVLPDADAAMKLMVLSLGLRLILPRTVAPTQDLMSSISSTPASLLLDAFGAGLTTEQSVSELAVGPDRAVIDHSISVPVGQLSEPEDSPSTKQSKTTSKRSIGPGQDELADFASTLQGKRVALYSTSQSFFARQVATFLSGLGCDVAPVFTDSVDESSFDGSDRVFGKHTHTAVALTSGRPALVSYTSDIDRRVHPTQPPSSNSPQSSSEQSKEDTQSANAVDTAVLDPVTGVPVTFDNSDHMPPVANQTPSPQPSPDNGSLSPETQIDSTGRRVVPFSFVIIDDDIVTLQKELLRIRSAVPLLKSALASKASPGNPPANERKPPRPTLDHRTKSSPQVNRLMASQVGNASTRSFGSLGTELMNGENTQEALASIDESVSQTIIFFTSMKSYRLVRDTVQPIIDSASFRGVSSPPEIMVLPKPAGPKRILTALHVAQHKPLVRLPFLPIATSPLSPLTTHSKTWWTSDSSQQQDGQGIMTLIRRQTGSTYTEEDTTPSTPWSPIEAAQPPEGPATPDIPLTKENLPLAAAPAAKGASNHTITKPSGLEEAPSTAATTTKSAPRSSVSRQTGTKPNADTPPPAAPTPADAATAPKSNSTPSAAPSTTSPPSSSQLRSQPVSSPMPADALEYFSETAAKMGGSAASGMVIQSPDGRPAGIFFQPKSTPSVSGSKPALNRGVSASSIRRGPPSEHSERSDGARERRMLNRSHGSSGSRRGSAADIHNLRPGDLPTLSEQGTAAGSAGTSESRGGASSQMANVGKYPSGSMFAPQVGIHSVLNSSRPPMTTPLASLASSSSQAQEGEGSRDQEGAKTQAKSDSGKQDAGKTESSAAVGSTSDKGSVGKAAGPGSTKSTASGATGGGDKNAATKPPITSAAAAPSTKSDTPNARTAAAAAHRLQPRQPASDKKPSAVPQSGFMMGMGFTSTSRPGRGPKKAPVREAVLPPIKVLIVEDNPINQRILSMFMGKKKIKYDVANNGREAVEKWKTGGYHLILMDIQLPVMDGIEATKEIRKLERSANIGILPNTPPATVEGGGGSRTVKSKAVVEQSQTAVKPEGGARALVNGVPTRTGGAINPFRASVIIVALTASVLSSDRVEALAAGCNDFLNKPVSLPWLNQKILEWGSMMYLMYSGLSSDDDVHHEVGAQRGDRAQLHLGFGYGPAEKAKALANNLHLGDTLAVKKKKREEERVRNQAQRAENVAHKEEQQREGEKEGKTDERGQNQDPDQGSKDGGSK